MGGLQYQGYGVFVELVDLLAHELYELENKALIF